MGSLGNNQNQAKPTQPNNSTDLYIVKEPGYASEDATFTNPEFGLMAIADGVTNGSTLTSFWSKLLVNDFCRLSQSRPCEYLRDKHQRWLQPLQDEWQKAFQKIINKSRQKKNSKTYNPLSSPAAQKKAKGAATFVGLHILPVNAQGKGQWQAIAIGDSCVFHFRKGSNGFDLASSFPLTKSDEFSSRTQCITSKANTSLIGNLQFVENNYELGDIFFLATDALAKWLLKNREEDKDEWKKLLEIDDQNAFEQMIKNLRDQHLIEIDDTTFSRMQVVTSPKEHTTTTNSTSVNTANINSNSLNLTSQAPVIPSHSALNTPSVRQTILPVINQAQNPHPPPHQVVLQTNSQVSPNTASVSSQQQVQQAVRPNGTIKSQQPVSKPFWQNKEFLKKTVMVAAGVAALASAAYLILHNGHDVSVPHATIRPAPSLLPSGISHLHDTLSHDIRDGALSGNSWEHLSKANATELQALAKHDPAIAQQLHETINTHLASQQRASEMLDAEKFKALRESGGVALKNFTPANKQLALKFINQTFQQHGLHGNFSSFSEAQQYISSQTGEQYHYIDSILVQDPETTYHQFDQAQHILNGHKVSDAIRQHWQNQEEGLTRARDALGKATAFNGSGVEDLAQKTGGTLNASAGDLIYIPPGQQAFDWGSATLTGLAVTKIAARGIARGVLSQAFPLVGTAIASYMLSKRTYDHLMTKADKLRILDERKDSTLSDRLRHAPMDLLRVTNSAIKDAPQDFRDMVGRIHDASKNIVSGVKSFLKSDEIEQLEPSPEMVSMYQAASSQR